jgi:hypothetical protein
VGGGIDCEEEVLGVEIRSARGYEVKSQGVGMECKCKCYYKANEGV